MTNTNSIKTTYQISNGLLYGTCWGGGAGSFPTCSYSEVFDSMDELKDFLNAQKSHDSGMGFQDEIGAIFTINIIHDIQIDGLPFCNIEITEIQIGELTEAQIDFLMYN